MNEPFLTYINNFNDSLLVSDYHESPTEILRHHPGARIFVGSLSAAEDLDFHTSVGVTHVLTAAGRLSVDVPTRPQQLAPVHIVLDLADHPTANLLRELPKSMEFIDSALGQLDGGIVLVHCASGVGRNVSIVVAYIAFYRMS